MIMVQIIIARRRGRLENTRGAKMKNTTVVNNINQLVIGPLRDVVDYDEAYSPAWHAQDMTRIVFQGTRRVVDTIFTHVEYGQ